MTELCFQPWRLSKALANCVAKHGFKIHKNISGSFRPVQQYGNTTHNTKKNKLSHCKQKL